MVPNMVGGSNFSDMTEPVTKVTLKDGFPDLMDTLDLRGSRIG